MLHVYVQVAVERLTAWPVVEIPPRFVRADCLLCLLLSRTRRVLFFLLPREFDLTRTRSISDASPLARHASCIKIRSHRSINPRFPIM